MLTRGSYPQGDPTQKGPIFWAPLAQLYPTWDCADLPALDWALRVMLRAKTFTVQVSYDTVVITTVTATDGSYQTVSSAAGGSGTFSADYVSTLADENAVLGSLAFGSNAQYATTAPEPLFGGCSFQVQDDATGLPNYLRAVLVRNATPTNGLPYILALDLQVAFVPPPPVYGGDVRVGGVGTGSLFSSQSPFSSFYRSIPAKFDGRAFSAGAEYSPAGPTYTNGYVDGSATTTTTATIYNASGITVQASGYWPYDGKYDPSTGTLA